MTEASVDYHNQVPEEVLIQIRNRCLVEAIAKGQVVAKAVRADVVSTWFVGYQDDDKWVNAIEIYPWIDEVMGRKLVLAALRELGEIALALKESANDVRGQ